MVSSNICLSQTSVPTKKRALREHESAAAGGLEEAERRASIPVSEIDAMQMTNWMSVSKTNLKPIDDDIKDARRRVTAAKGPKKRPAPAVEEAGSDAESSCASG